MTTQGPFASGTKRANVDQGALSHAPLVLFFNYTSGDLLIPLTLYSCRILSS